MKKTCLNPVLLGLCLTIPHSPASLASTDDKLEHFISLSLEELISLETTIATATKHTTSKAPAVVTLITSEDIKATGATNLIDVLEGVPGIHVKFDYFGNRPLVSFRGNKPNQTLLMVNGNSMKDLTWGFGFFWKGLSANIIERIEIIRGPGSALFGADASAGVINVITKTAGQIKHSEASVRAGSFNTQTAWMQHGDNWKGYNINVTAEIHTSDGHAPIIETDFQTTLDRIFGTTVTESPGNANYGWKQQDIRFSIAKDHWRLHTDYIARKDVEIGLTGAGILDPLTQAKDSLLNIDLFYTNDSLFNNWTVNAELRYQNLDYDSGEGFRETPPGFDDGSGPYPDGQLNHISAAERRFIAEASALYSGIKHHSIRLGSGYNWQDLYSVEHARNFDEDATGTIITPGDPVVDISDTPYAILPEETRKITYFFLQDVWNINNQWELTTGARYDDYNDFGSTFNPRLALVWQTSNKLTSKLMYGEAFRAPSYLQLFAITSRATPNPDLKPEQSKTWDLQFNFTASKTLQLSMNLFNYELSDIIERDINKKYQNTGTQTIRGIELEAQWQIFDNLLMSGNFTTRNQDEEFRDYSQPEKEAYARIDWGFKKNWSWNIQANWINERDRDVITTTPDTRPALSSQTITDSTLRYVASNHLEVAISIRNIFDIEAKEFTGKGIPNDFPLPERNAYVEARYKF